MSCGTTNKANPLAALWVICALLCYGVEAQGEGRALVDSLRDQLPHIGSRLQSSEIEALAQIYLDSQAVLYWTEGVLPTKQALRLIEVVRQSSDYGLRSTEYSSLLNEIESLQAKLRPGDSDTRARFDMVLSAAALRFVTQIHQGRINTRSAGFELPAHSELNALNVVRALATTQDLSATIATFEPISPSYRRLKAALILYRTLAGKAHLNDLAPLPKAVLEEGDIYVDAVRLRRLLEALGDANTDYDDTSEVFSKDLSIAVTGFQRRNGLTPDGRIGAKTFAALTMPLNRRVRQIELSLERWRWVPHLELPLIVINIPQYRLFALPRESAVSMLPPLEMSVVVGRREDRTPIFMSAIESVVFRPYWNVPRSILHKELLPLIRRDPDYLQQHDMEIVNGAGDDAFAMERNPETLDMLASGQLRLRQRPGPKNSLGLIKFVLPNPYNVYLHGSPEIQLFAREHRSLSHGCIRVPDPAGLAEYVLRDAGENWNRERIEQAMFGANAVHVRLQNKLPILIFYTTVVATASHGMLFFDDVYGLDRKLEILLGLEPPI